MISFCKTCIMPDSRPRISINNEGICNACTNSILKKNINWKEREKEFFELVEKIKKKKEK